MSKGYVYILTNPCIQYTYKKDGEDITISPVKIGMAKDVEKRLGSLNTSLPENFVHHLSVFSNDSKALENIVHQLLKDYRIDTKHGDRTEFFRCTVEEAVSTLKKTAKYMHLKEYKIDKSKLIGRSSCKIKSNSKAARDAKASSCKPLTTSCGKRKDAFTFTDIGLSAGTKLQFIHGPQTVIIADAKRIVYDGATYSLSGFVRKFMPVEKQCASGAYQGPKYFTYKGKTLIELRDAMTSTT